MLHGDYSKYRKSFKAIKRTIERYFSRMETMTDRVIAAAKLKGMRQKAEIERYCNIPPRTLTNMAGGHRPKDGTLLKICEALDITESYVLYGDDVPNGIAEQKSLIEKPRTERRSTNKLKRFIGLLSTMDDEDIDTVLEYMAFLKSRKGKS